MAADTSWTGRLRQPVCLSILAVNPDNGELKWHYQAVPGDSWDIDTVQQLILADIEIDGRSRKVLMQASKGGFFYVLDRITGEFLSATFAPLNWASATMLPGGRGSIVRRTTRRSPQPSHRPLEAPPIGRRRHTARIHDSSICRSAGSPAMLCRDPLRSDRRPVDPEQRHSSWRPNAVAGYGSSSDSTLYRSAAVSRAVTSSRSIRPLERNAGASMVVEARAVVRW